MKNAPILYFLVAVGCNAGDVTPPPVDVPTTGGYGDTGDGDTEAGSPDECWSNGAPVEAVRWQCEGLAEATVIGTLQVDVPDWLDNAEFIRQTIDYGRLDWIALFGPWNGEAYDDPGIAACCLPDIGGDEQAGADETGAEPPGEEAIPQAATACSHDCADQACRAIPKTLRDFAKQIPPGVPVEGPSYRNQLRDLSNWVAAHQQDCFNAMIADGVHEGLGNYIIDGEWQIPNGDDWPDVTDLSVRGECKVFDWYLPEAGDPQACSGLNDNNGEDPFGDVGSVGGFDTFVPTGGEMELDGPVIFGVQAAGAATLLGLGDACPRGECSRLDAWVSDEMLELRRMVLVAPSSLSWAKDGMRLTVDGLHAMVEHPLSIPLYADGDVMRFELLEGDLEFLFAGSVHGVPVKLEVPNVTPVTGSVTTLFDGSHSIVIDPFTVEYLDGHGTWAMHVELGELVAVDHAPRVLIDAKKVDGETKVDASATFDPDGDALAFEWYLDGALIGQGPTVEPVVGGLSTLLLRVVDDTGRSAWSNGLVVDVD